MGLGVGCFGFEIIDKKENVMAIGDLALVKLVSSVVKKTKEKIVGTATEEVTENESGKLDESVQATFKAMLGKKEEPISSEDNASKKTETKTEEKEPVKATVKSEEPKIAVKKTTTKTVKSKPVKKESIEKKSTPVAKKSTPAKSPAKKAATGAKKEAKIKLYTADVQKHYGSVDDTFLAIVVKNLGPSIYRKDAELVSCSDPKELDTVRKNFLIKKLGYDKSENEMLNGEIQKVCETLKGVRTKYRATFYYILAKNLKKESALS
jgi:hypothetical protein